MICIEKQKMNLSTAKKIDKMLNEKLKGKQLPGSHEINSLVSFLFFAKGDLDSDDIRMLLLAEENGIIKDLKEAGGVDYYFNHFNEEDSNFKFWVIFENGISYPILEKEIKKLFED